MSAEKRPWWRTPEGHIPYRNRMGLALAVALLMVVAGWGRPVWIVAPVAAIWPVLVGIGMWAEWRDDRR